ncbi:MAG TPA: signal peptide peptidase SppA [Xanthomonadales bacterium]|nr:signal peptide peptidase SppA [Xanthomonadales bacterium]
MANEERSILTRMLLGAWHFIDGARKLVLNAIFLLILFFVVRAMVESGESLLLQTQTALVISPYGDVVEQYSGTPLDQALQNATEPHRQETRLRDLVRAILRARDDEHIISLVIDPTYLRHIGLASLQELETAIADFKTSGKPVVAVTDNMSQQQYYLAATADEVWLHPEGMVWIDGFSAYRNFFHEGLEKLEVEINLFRVGEYKSAMEPYIRDDMSDEDREANLFWLGSLWQQYLEAISRERGVPLVDLSSAINQFADRLEAAQGDFSRLALELGLVDRLISRPEAHQELAARGAPGKDGNGFRHIGFDHYLALTDTHKRSRSNNKVVVVVAEGEIISGEQPPGRIGAETMAVQLRAVGEDAKARAVVLRMNSPGGESFASEKIRREVQALRESGKTVVISMGDVAASGAYWIAMAGEEVWASPASITGSIGVFGMIPTFSRPLERIGIHTDGVGTTPLAGKLRLDLPLDTDLKRIFQSATEQTYREFIGVVAQGRNMTENEVERVARGRVWSGVQARELGLVDQTGSLQQAIDSAARIAGLGADYEVQYSETELSPLEAFVLDMMGSSASRLGLRPHSWTGGSLLENLLKDLHMLTRAGSGFSLAAHCLCQAP